MAKIFVYAGSWTVQAKGAEDGIGVYEYAPADGSLRFVERVRPDLVAGAMCVDPVRGVLYAVDESADSPAFGGKGGGGRVVALAIDPESGRLTQRGSERSALGTLTAGVALDGSRSFLVAVNHSDKQAITKYCRSEDGAYHAAVDYSAVTAVLYPLDEDGAIGQPCDVLEFPPDRSVIPARIACLHSVNFAPDGETCVITNMKQDRVVLLRLDREDRRLVRCAELVRPAGTFPRYGVFHPTKNAFYLNNEHAFMLNVLRRGESSLELVQTVDATPTLTPELKGQKVMQTDVKLSADGRFLYNFYRGANTVQVWSVDPASGCLSKLQELTLGPAGGSPRGAAIAPDGRFVLVASNLDHLIKTLAVAPDGTLTLTGTEEGSMRYPGCLCFYEAH